MLKHRAPLFATICALLLISAFGQAQQDQRSAQSSNQRKEVTRIVDQRTPLALSDDEAAFIRREMRGLLESIREILDAAGTSDRQRIIAAARRAGMNGPEAEHIPQSLAPKLPLEFRKLGLATHRAFDQIALDVEKSGAAALVHRQLADLMNNCTACHATWRIVDDGRR